MASLLVPGVIVASTTGAVTVAAVTIVAINKLRRRFTTRRDRQVALSLLANADNPFDPDEIEQLVETAPPQPEVPVGTMFTRPTRKGNYVKERRFGKLIIRRVDNVIDVAQDIAERDARVQFHNLRKSEIMKLATTFALECRFSLNLIRDTEANRLVARSWLISKATELRLNVKERKTFIAFSVPIVFLPTEGEIEVSRVMNTGPVQTRIDNAKTRFISWTPPCQRYPLGKFHFAIKGTLDA